MYACTYVYVGETRGNEVHYQCNLTTPAYFVQNYHVCDGIYECPDRSDESGCSLDFEGTSTLDDAPPITQFRECQLPAPLSREDGRGIVVGTECRE